VQRELADGRRIRGRRIGLTSPAMQLASQITEPDSAPLLDDMFFDAGGDIPIERFIVPRAEVELAFVFGQPLKGPGVTLFGEFSALQWMTPAIEITGGWRLAAAVLNHPAHASAGRRRLPRRLRAAGVGGASGRVTRLTPGN
jgi:2-keto-4-pentenoate hydratase